MIRADRPERFFVKTPAPAEVEPIMAMEVEKGPLDFPFWEPARRRFNPDSEFFSSGNIERELLAKQIALDLTGDERKQLEKMEDEGRTFYCPISGCGAALNSVEGFEDHYIARHMAACSVCSRVYPTSRLLSIHVSEAHDSFFHAKVARGFPMYECLVESCGLKFKHYNDRQQHLVDKHKFPAGFQFYKKALPSKKQRQKKLRQRKQSHDNSGKEEAPREMEVEDQGAMDGLVSAVSRLSTSDSSPSSISFGRRNSRGLTFVPRAVRREPRQDSSRPGVNG